MHMVSDSYILQVNTAWQEMLVGVIVGSFAIFPQDWLILIWRILS